METSSQIYVNPLSDAGFKALLCDPANKPVLIGMLNAFLPPDRTVEDLEYGRWRTSSTPRPRYPG